MNRLIQLFRQISNQKAGQIAVQLFLPVAVAAVLYGAGWKLSAFLVFQLFIEGFVLWQFSMGYNLSADNGDRTHWKWFVASMLFALTYRLGTNGYQAWYYTEHSQFPELEKLLWLTPIHLVATAGSIYCFYLNARWLRRSEAQRHLPIVENLRSTFLKILVFPYGLWQIQPRLNALKFNTLTKN